MSKWATEVPVQPERGGGLMGLDEVVQVRGWSGGVGRRPPTVGGIRQRIGDRVSLVVFAASHVDADADQLGLGGFLVVYGRSLIDGGLLVPDDTDGGTLDALRTWAGEHVLGTLAGDQPWRVVTVGEFFDPMATASRTPWAFHPRAYGGRGFVIGADWLRTFSLLAERVTPADGGAGRVPPWADGWRVWLPGVGRVRDEGRWSRATPHRPELVVRRRRVGAHVLFAPTPGDRGKHHDGRVWRGAFVDLATLAYVLDGQRGASFAEHAEVLGVSADELPLRLRRSPDGADQVAAALEALREVALAADDRAAGWFTSAGDRSTGGARIDVTSVASAGALAADLLARTGVDAPLRRFAVTDDEHRRWAAAFHGGWASADSRLAGRPFPVAAVDVHACFPLVAHLLGWWPLVCADHLLREDVAAPLAEVCDRAAADPTAVLDPALWSRFGATVVEVDPSGLPFPVALEDESRPDGRAETVPLFAAGRTLTYSWPDVVAAAVLSGRSPRIVSATRLVPVGHQELRRRVPVVPGLVLDTDADPVLGLVARRRRAKADGDRATATVLHAVVNALVSGNFSRFDDRWVKVPGRRGENRWVVHGHAAPWTWWPVAVSVQAGAHLLLATIARMVDDLGGTIAYRDTDSSLIPASPTGGTIAGTQGQPVRLLTWTEVDELVSRFAPLSPEPAWPVFGSVDRGTPERPLHSVVVGLKRHVEFVAGPGGPEVVERTEANLGGWYADPPTMGGRHRQGGRVWTWDAAQRTAAWATAQARNPDRALRSGPVWDPQFPALRRLAARDPATLASLPASLAARAGSRYLEGQLADMSACDERHPVALDPGGDLADWRQLRWVDRRSGESVMVTTDFMDAAATGAVCLARLDARAAAWARPPNVAAIDQVTVTPHNVQVVGRVSGVIDAHLNGEPGEMSRRRPRYVDADRVAMVRSAAQAMGSTAFARVTGLPARTADRVVAGQPPAARTVERAFAALRQAEAPLCGCGCGLPVLRRQGALYVDEAHRLRAKKRRQRASDLSTTHPARKGHDRKAIP